MDRPRFLFLFFAAFLLALTALDRFGPAIRVDDAYITFRYAENLARGRGFVYNPGERVLGTSAPAYALTLAALRWLFGVSPLQTAAALDVVAVVILGLAAYGLFRGLRPRGLALLVPVPLLVADPLRACHGMESFVFVALGTLALLGCVRNRPFLFGLTAALATLTRPDGAVLAALLVLYRTLADRRFPWRAVAAGLVIALPWTVWATAYFGSPWPATLAAKMAQARASYWRPYLPALALDFVPRHYALWTALGLAGCWLALREGHPGAVLAALWLLAQNVLYAAAGAPDYPWYFIPFATQIALLAAYLVLRAGEALAHAGLNVTRGARYAAVLTLLGLVLPGLQRSPSWPQRLSAAELMPRKDPYYRLGRWLARHTPPHATVACLETGVLGYFSERPILDGLGLLTPGLAERVPEKRHVDFLMTRYRPDYVVHQAPFTGHEVNLDQYLYRSYWPVQVAPPKVLCRRRPWDEASLAQRVARALRGTERVVYCGDLPLLFDFERFRAEARRRVRGVRFTRALPPLPAHALQIGRDGTVSVRPFGPAALVPFGAAVLAQWRTSPGVAARRVTAAGLELRLSKAYAYLWRDLRLKGPVRRLRLRFRLGEPLPRRAGDARVYVTVAGPDGRKHTDRLCYTWARTAAWQDVLVYLPGEGIGAQEQLTLLRLDPADQPAVVTLAAVILERV